MSKPITVNILGKEYPLVLTVHGLDELTELMGGGLDVLGSYLAGNEDGTKTMGTMIDHNLRVLELLIRSGMEYRTVQAEFLGTTPEHLASLNLDILRAVILPGEIPGIQLKNLEAVNASMNQTVEVEPSKNPESGEPQ